MEPTPPEKPESLLPFDQRTQEDRWLTSKHLQQLNIWLIGNNSTEKTYALELITRQKEAGILDALASYPAKDQYSRDIAFKAKLLLNHLEPPTNPKPPQSSGG